MASNTPWILRANDPVWRDDHDYKKGHRITGSNGAIYIARQDNGPNTAAGAKDPVNETTGDYWISLTDSLKSGGDNELTGATTAKKLETPRTIAGMSFDGSADISNYAVCATQSSSAEKAVSIDNFVLVPGASVRIRFTNGNTSTTPTLNISDTGAKELRFDNAQLKSDYIDKNGTYDIVYDGTYYQIVNGGITLKAPAADKLSTARSIQGIKFDGTSDIYNYATCSSAADAAEKEAALRGFELAKGSLVHVKFTEGSTCLEPTLNINKTGARKIKWNGEALQEYFIDKNGIYDFVYDGDYYQMLNGGPTVVSPSTKKLDTAKSINGISFDGSADISNYGVCTSAKESNAKTTSITGFTLSEGASARIRFVNGNTNTTPTLNINETGAVPLRYNGANLDSDSIIADGIYDIVYLGNCYQIVNGGTTMQAPAATKLANARAINGVQFDGTSDIGNYGICGTAAGTAAKTVSISKFVLVKGAVAYIRFTYGSTSTAPTLNINNTGAKQLKYNNGAIQSYYIAAQSTYEVVYDGTYYQLVGNISGTTSSTSVTNNTNITSISSPGSYVAHNVNCSVNNGYPYDANGKDVSLTVSTTAGTNYMCQVLHVDKSEWHRFSSDAGKNWGAWHPIGGTIDTLGTVYLALNGNDNNTGLSASKPVRTVDRALQICRGIYLRRESTYYKEQGNKGMWKTNYHGYCVLSFGSGNWGTVTISDVPVNIVMKGTSYNFDNNAYLSSMPYFDIINIQRCQYVDIGGITFAVLYGAGANTVIKQAGYLRAGSINLNEHAKFITGFSHSLDFYNYTMPSSWGSTSYRNCFYCNEGGRIVCYWYNSSVGQQKIRIISSINVGTGHFLCLTEPGSGVDCGGNFANMIQVNSGCTVTGSKYYIANNDMSYPGITKASADKLPGTKAGTYNCGRIVLESVVSGANWYRKWSDGWIEQGGLISKIWHTRNFAGYSYNFHTAFSNSGSINLHFTPSQKGTTVGVNGNYCDDTIIYEYNHWTTGFSVGIYDEGTKDNSDSSTYVCFYWHATGY